MSGQEPTDFVPSDERPPADPAALIIQEIAVAVTALDGRENDFEEPKRFGNERIVIMGQVVDVEFKAKSFHAHAPSVPSHPLGTAFPKGQDFNEAAPGLIAHCQESWTPLRLQFLRTRQGVGTGRRAALLRLLFQGGD
jgi:hypothetical protein